VLPKVDILWLFDSNSILLEHQICAATVFSCETLFQEVFKIPKLTVEERKRTERELGKILH